MILSMTGFGQGASESSGFRVAVDVRTVNHRFVDVRVRVPPELSGYERLARNRILAVVRRGRVEAGFRIERTDDAPSTWTWNRPLAAAVVEASVAIAAEHGVDQRLDAAMLLRVPGMFVEDRSRQASSDDLAAALKQAAGEALDRALERLQADRAREGEGLRVDLVERARTMRGLAVTLGEHAGEVPRRVREKLLERLATLSQGTDLDPVRLAQEATFLADRSDVTEELVRLDAHLAEAERILTATDDEPVGRRMDFLVQEIHRETNTINSKSSDLEISRAAMALKTETEKVREQVQNLE